MAARGAREGLWLEQMTVGCGPVAVLPKAKHILVAQRETSVRKHLAPGQAHPGNLTGSELSAKVGQLHFHCVVHGGNETS